MENLNISRGFTPKLIGNPDLTMIRIPTPGTIGLSAGDIPFIRPKLLIKKGDAVKTGTPLFTDKRDLSIQYLSPATGQVKEIVFGPRRRLEQVVIETGPADDFLRFDPVMSEQLAEMEKETLVDHLKKGGLWQGLRQFPAMDTADPGHLPPMIIVSLNGNDIFSPHPALVLEGRMDAFKAGMAALEKFTHKILVTARQSSLSRLKKIEGLTEQITHVTQDIYPAWNPGTVLYKIKQGPAENASWCISLDHLLMIGDFLNSGQYPVDRVVTLTREGDQRPHLLTRQGVSIHQLAGSIPKTSMITTGQFNGRELNRESHLGFFENTVNIIGSTPEEEMFGFVRPGLDKTTVSSSFLSSLFKGPAKVDCTLHGELRACINCSYCERICPNEMMPNFIMKALHADEVEEALSMGLMDCCQCGLCSFTCPSKIELAQILSQGMASHHKDKA